MAEICDPEIAVKFINNTLLFIFFTRYALKTLDLLNIPNTWLGLLFKIVQFIISLVFCVDNIYPVLITVSHFLFCKYNQLAILLALVFNILPWITTKLVPLFREELDPQRGFQDNGSLNNQDSTTHRTDREEPIVNPRFEESERGQGEQIPQNAVFPLIANKPREPPAFSREALPSRTAESVETGKGTSNMERPERSLGPQILQYPTFPKISVRPRAPPAFSREVPSRTAESLETGKGTSNMERPEGSPRPQIRQHSMILRNSIPPREPPAVLREAFPSRTSESLETGDGTSNVEPPEGSLGFDPSEEELDPVPTATSPSRKKVVRKKSKQVVFHKPKTRKKK